MTDTAMEARFDPGSAFTIDRWLVRNDIIPGDIILFRRSFWAEPRYIMVVVVIKELVTALEQRRTAEGPQRRRGVRMLQLEDETCSG